MLLLLLFFVCCLACRCSGCCCVAWSLLLHVDSIIYVCVACLCVCVVLCVCVCMLRVFMCCVGCLLLGVVGLLLYVACRLSVVVCCLLFAGGCLICVLLRGWCSLFVFVAARSVLVGEDGRSAGDWQSWPAGPTSIRARRLGQTRLGLRKLIAKNPEKKEIPRDILLVGVWKSACRFFADSEKTPKNCPEAWTLWWGSSPTLTSCLSSLSPTWLARM